MSRIPDAFIDELLARTDIVSLIGERVELKRAGREFHARCPFHDERTPSFTVSPSKQFYHCFGCAAHGTALRFLMEYERLEFLDAIEELAQRAGLSVPRETQTRHTQGFEELYAVTAAASEFFVRKLEGEPRALAYLHDRGVDDATISAFALGYAPDSWSALKDSLGGDERRLRLLERVGLLSRSESDRTYDKFRDRIVFPIEDRRGRVIAFGGRVIKKDDEPKYLNSPETPLFHKGRELYGLHRARQADTRLARLIVVEGYMDVVSLAQAGISQCVATLGTSVTSEQIELMFRSVQDVYFCFDGDRAGRAAAWRAVENTLTRMRDGRQAHFLFLPEGEDPDSIVRSEGAAALEARLAAATPLSQVLFDELGRDATLDSIEGRARLAERVKPLIEKIPDGAFRDLMRDRASTMTGVGAKVQPVVSTARPPVSQGQRGGRVSPPSLLRKTVAMLVQQPALAQLVQPPFRFALLQEPGIPLLVELLEHLRAHPDLHTGALLEHWRENEDYSSLLKLAALEFDLAPEQWEQQFLGAIDALDAQTVPHNIEILKQILKTRPFSAEESEAYRNALEAKTRIDLAASRDS